jgi:hypothetical protein
MATDGLDHTGSLRELQVAAGGRQDEVLEPEQL